MSSEDQILFLIDITGIHLQVSLAGQPVIVRELVPHQDNHMVGTRPGDIHDDLPNHPKLANALDEAMMTMVEVFARLEQVNASEEKSS